MKQTKLLMGMPITIEIVDNSATGKFFEKAFDYFRYIEKKFSVYKETSEVNQINEGLIKKSEYSKDMKTVFKLSSQTKQKTNGYFNIKKNGKYDPSGLVKGWAILNVAKIIKREGFMNYYVDAGGDIQVSGKNREGKKWKVGIQNPFSLNEIIKTVVLTNQGIATSGTYLRGQHVYNPFSPKKPITEIVSFSIIGPNVYEADRFATAAFAMGKEGIQFIENLSNFEGYVIDKNGIATLTSGFDKYTIKQ